MSTRVAKRNGVVILKPNGKLIGNAVNELSQNHLWRVAQEW